MGLFGSIGKVFGGALKVAGKVAGIASAVAPIPGLGFAGKVAGGIGGFLGKARRIQGKVLGPGALTALSSTMPGGSQANQSFYTSGYAGSGPGPGGVLATARGISKGMGKRKRRKRRVSSSRRRSSRRRREKPWMKGLRAARRARRR